ncbi:MAG: O-methyltransferase [Muribaculaceae bacterium]|nr:O-methyltransferase [Muribaculaceae bacterium]
MSPELQKYIEEHIDREPEHLYRLERATNIHLINGRMCSGHLQGRLLKMLVSMIRPKDVLELGTFSGYSALCIAEALEEEGRIHTVEADDELEDFIRRALNDSPHGHKVCLHIADALGFARESEPESFDLVFMDADKRRYADYYEACLPLLRPGGYIIADNTLWDGKVVDTTANHDAQTVSLDRFNSYVASNPELETVIIPVRDGLTLIRKK